MTEPAPMAVSSTREPSRVQLAIAPASDLASVCVLTLRHRPSLSTDGRRDLVRVKVRVRVRVRVRIRVRVRVRVS